MKIKFLKLKTLLSVVLLAAISCNTSSKLTSIDSLNIDQAYKTTLLDRTQKIVTPLALSNSQTAQKVQNVLINQYVIINNIHSKYDSIEKNIKTTNEDNKNELLDLSKKEKANSLLKAKNIFVSTLSKYVNENQLVQIKDGMTYGVLPKTWASYQEMLPNLTQPQKDTMYNWLVKARDFAIMEGTSDKKHAMFGKYKGKINNYLSKQGYDMKKESRDWAARVKAANEQKKQTNSNNN